jgi:hypothetical protein
MCSNCLNNIFSRTQTCLAMVHYYIVVERLSRNLCSYICKPSQIVALNSTMDISGMSMQIVTRDYAPVRPKRAEESFLLKPRSKSLGSSEDESHQFKQQFSLQDMLAPTRMRQSSCMMSSARRHRISPPEDSPPTIPKRSPHKCDSSPQVPRRACSASTSIVLHSRQASNLSKSSLRSTIQDVLQELDEPLSPSKPPFESTSSLALSGCSVYEELLQLRSNATSA